MVQSDLRYELDTPFLGAIEGNLSPASIAGLTMIKNVGVDIYFIYFSSFAILEERSCVILKKKLWVPYTC